jgi:hypothetical protein
MAELKRRNSEPFSGDSKANPSFAQSRIRSSVFKYYIHDGVEAWRFQLLGLLSEHELPELRGCWSTAKCTLGNRKLVLDLRRLHSTDEAGKEWLLSMALEGATYLPESYFRTNLSGHSTEPPEETGRRTGFFSKISSLVRGSRTLPVESSTQAQ